MGQGQLDNHMQKNKTVPLSTPYTKINSKQIKDLNIRPEILKLLEENIGSKLLDISLGDDFFGFDIKSKANQSENKQVDYIILKSIFTAKETINNMKR